MLQRLSEVLGCTEPALRVTISLYAGWPLALIYRKYLYGKLPTVQHLYFTACGLSLLFFNYGIDVCHSIISVFVAYLICRFGQGSRPSVWFAFVFYMTYLTLGYYYTATDDYDIKWTIPQCILTLRLIGLVMDVYDGRKPEEKLSKDQKEMNIKDPPGLLEIAAYTYFYGSFFVGPQYPLTRLRKMVNGDYSNPKTGGPPDSTKVALQRLGLGIAYMTAYQLLTFWIPSSYLTSDDFHGRSFVAKLGLVFIWWRMITAMYQSVWLIVESSCILSGLAYNGDTPEGEPKYDGVRNIRLTKFELGHTFQSVIESYNCNTNLWAARYVFKRLRVLGMKPVSHVLTLFFLGFWHGLASGYYACFFFEYFCVIMERQATYVLTKMPKVSAILFAQPLRTPVWLFQKFIVYLGCTWGFLGFSLLKFDRWFSVYKDLYFCAWIGYAGVWPLTFFLLRKYVLPKERREKAKGDGVENDKKES